MEITNPGSGAPIIQGSGSETPSVIGGPSQGSGAKEQITVDKDYLSGLFSSGMKERDSRILELLKSQGYTGDKNKVDDALTEFITGIKTPPKKDEKNAGANASEEFETLRLQLAEEKKLREQAEADKHQYIGDVELTASLADPMGPRLVDGALNPAKDLFKGTYSIKRNGEGEIRVYQKNGELLRTDKMEPASVKDAVQMFLKANPFFVSATAKGRGSNPQNRSVNSGDFMDTFSNASPADKMKMARELLEKKVSL